MSVVERLRWLLADDHFEWNVRGRAGLEQVSADEVEALLAVVLEVVQVDYAEHALNCRSQFHSKNRGPCNCANGRLEVALAALYADAADPPLPNPDPED